VNATASDDLPDAWKFHNTLPPYVEIETEHYRAVVDNFFTLPIGLLIALRKARQQHDGTDIHILLDAAELAFNPEDFTRAQELSITHFFDLIKVWVHNSGSQP
jgi:hypothetical protein